ncbi:MAG: NAD(+) synthase [Bacillota bacterium]
MAALDEAMERKVQFLVEWMKERGAEARAKGAIFGVSGGIDSALVLALAKRAWPQNCLGLVLPCHSLQEDVDDALDILKQYECPYRVLDLSDTYETLLRSLPSEGPEECLRLARANLKPRLRMLTLYYHANLLNYMVVGTGNRDEIYVGYSTKYGDGGVDIQPLGALTKGEVRELARYLGVPPRIVGKPPSAGLWEGQTDEEEMGITYRDIDAYLQGQEVPEEVRLKIERRHRTSEHKRRTPPIPEME